MKLDTMIVSYCRRKSGDVPPPIERISQANAKNMICCEQSEIVGEIDCPAHRVLDA